MKNRIIAVVTILIIALIAGGSVVAYNKNIESQIASEKKSYNDYVDENGGMLYISDIKAIHSFIEDYSHKNKKVQSEVLYHAREELNDTLEIYLDGEHHSLDSLEEISDVVKEPYVHSSNMESYEIAKEETIKEMDYISSLTDEDFDRIIEHNANFVDIGYTEEQVIEKLGKPYDITSSTSAYGVSKVFEYEDRLIYFVDGEVTRVVDF